MPYCTIIILTYNRPSCLQRILDYYNNYGNDFNIIVADSSSDENKVLNKKIVSSFTNLKILYLGHYSEKIITYYKFADAVNHAKSKYSLFCADDDFVAPNGIKQSIKFLEAHSDFIVVHGTYLSFYFKNNKKGKQFYWRESEPYKSIIFPEAGARLNFHLSNYQVSTFYAVHRTANLRMIFVQLLASKVDPLLFGELLLSMLTLIYGKMKRLDVLYAVKEIHLKSVKERYGHYWPSLIDFFRNQGPGYDKEYPKFRNCLAANLCRASHLNIKESEKIVDRAMTRYIKKNYSLGFAGQMVRILKTLNTPGWAYKRIKLLYRRLAPQSKGINSFHSQDFLPAKYCDDFDKIRTCVTQYEK